MRSRVVVFMMFTALAVAARTHAETVACTTALADIFAEVHGESANQTPAPFNKKKEAFLSIYRTATEGLTIEELEGLMREPFDFVDFEDARQLGLAREKLKILKEKGLQNFSTEEQKVLMSAIQIFLAEKISRAQKSQTVWNEKREKEKEIDVVQILEGHGHTDWVRAIAFSPDGTQIASGSTNHTIRLWDLRNRTAAPIILKAHTSFISSVAFSPDGTRLASGSGDENILIWNPKNPTAFPTTVRRRQSDPNWLFSVAFSPDGRFLASSSLSGYVHVWNPHDPEADPITLKNRNSSSAASTSLAFSPDSTKLAVGYDDGFVRIWYPADPTSLEIYKDQQSSITAMTFSADGAHLASGDNNSMLLIRNANNLSATPIILRSGHQGTAYYRSLAFSRDGRFLAGAISNTLQLWDLKNLGTPRILEGHTEGVESVDFSPDGNTLASGSRDNTIRLWNWRKILGLDPFEEDAR